MTESPECTVAKLKQTVSELRQELGASVHERKELCEQQAATAEVLKIISRSTFTLDSVMETLARAGSELCGADLGGVYLCDGEFLICRGFFPVTGEPAEFARRNSVQVDDDSYMGRSVLTGAVANIPDFESDTGSRLRKFQQAFGFRAILFVPLMRDGKGIGCFSLARHKVGAFTKRQVDLVQVFADQAIIAIENARLFEEVQERTRELAHSLETLRAAQDRLVQTEKMASLSHLTAGIAHEINSPVGTSLTIASSLVKRCTAFANEHASGQLRRSQLKQFVEGNCDAANLLVTNLQRAGQLVQSFKQLAVDRTNLDRHRFDLKRATDQIMAGMSLTLGRFDGVVEIDIPDGIVMDSYPGPYGQILNNLFVNAVSHGFDEIHRGQITIKAYPVRGGHVEIVFNDDGRGMSRLVRHHAFDPFFTTRRNRGAVGLGLHIVHTIVTQQLGGGIVLNSELEQGATFVISIPMIAPG